MISRSFITELQQIRRQYYRFRCILSWLGGSMSILKFESSSIPDLSMTTDQDGLMEVLNEESYVKEALMWIDTSSARGTSSALFIFFGLTFLCLVSGFKGNPSIINHISTQAFTPGNGSEIIHFDAAPISSLNRFLTFKIALNGHPSTTEPITFSYQVIPFPKTQTTPAINGTIDKRPLSTDGS
jgi:hypothetical protein